MAFSLSQRFDATARSVSEGWTGALQQQARGSEAVTAGLQQALGAFTATSRFAMEVMSTFDSLFSRM